MLSRRVWICVWIAYGAGCRDPRTPPAAPDGGSAQPDSALPDGAQPDGAQPDGAQPDSGSAQPDGSVGPSFEIVLDSRTCVDLDMFPAVNADGVIAYICSRELGMVGVYTHALGQVATIAEFRGPVFSASTVGGVSINAHGAVAFDVLERAPDDWAVFKGTPGTLTKITDTAPPSPLLATFGTPMIDNAGSVVFGAMVKGGGDVIMRGDGGPTSTLAKTGDQILQMYGAGGPAAANAGNIAFVADRGHANGLGVFAVVGDQLHMIASDHDGVDVLEGPAAMNGRGDIAFLTSEGIYVTTNGGPPTARAAVNANPVLAADGALAYVELRAPPSGQPGVTEAIVLIPPNHPPITVVQTGEPMLGSTSQLLALSRGGVAKRADGYDVVFGVQLADSQHLIGRVLVHVDP
jgi:hypothetical protein